MNKSTKLFRRLEAVRSLVGALEDSQVLESGQSEALSKSLKKLEHALRVRDLKQAEASIDEIARVIIGTSFDAE